MTSLPCPKCEGELQLVSTPTAQYTRCHACAGAWFAVAGLAAHYQARFAPVAAARVQEIDEQPMADCDVRCPSCWRAMKRLTVARVEVEYCQDCRGIFLDAGELQRIASFGGVSLGQLRQPEDAIDRLNRDDQAPETTAGLMLSIVADLLDN